MIFFRNMKESTVPVVFTPVVVFDSPRETVEVDVTVGKISVVVAKRVDG